MTFVKLFIFLHIDFTLGGPLHFGDIEELADNDSLCVKCPWHNWRFDLKNGKVVGGLHQNLRAVVYPIKLNQKDNIYVGFNSIAPSYFANPCF